jgi:hypothetical protein
VLHPGLFFFLYHLYPEFEKKENTQYKQRKCEYYKQVAEGGFIYFGKKPQDHLNFFVRGKHKMLRQANANFSRYKSVTWPLQKRYVPLQKRDKQKFCCYKIELLRR